MCQQGVVAEEMLRRENTGYLGGIDSEYGTGLSPVEVGMGRRMWGVSGLAWSKR